MKHYIFAIYDAKAEAFITPFFLPTRAMAVRSFETAVNDPNSMICKYALDYSLFELGTFDDTNGRVEPLPQNKLIVLANNLKVKQTEEEKAAETLQIKEFGQVMTEMHKELGID